MMVAGLTLLLCLSLTAIHCNIEFKHHNNTELAAILQKVHNKCPDVTRLYTLSEPSVQGVPLYVLEFSDKPGHHEVTEPEMKYIASMHPDGWQKAADIGGKDYLIVGTTPMILTST